MIKIKRIYELSEKTDGCRILGDRPWPWSLSKEKAKVDLWLKEIAPSPELRQWFGHDPKKWPEFQQRYRQELKARKELLNMIKQRAEKDKTVTLLFAASDLEQNNAVVRLQQLRK